MRTEKWWKIAAVYLGASYRGRAAQRRAASTWAGLHFLPVLFTMKPTLHAPGTQATLSVTTMWLLRCCSHKGKRSSGVVGACAIERHTQICSKAAIQRAPLEEARCPSATRGLRFRFRIWGHFLISPQGAHSLKGNNPGENLLLKDIRWGLIPGVIVSELQEPEEEER